MYYNTIVENMRRIIRYALRIAKVDALFPINRIIVTAEREEHIWTKHAVSREDVDDVCFSDPLVRRGREGSYGIYGQTRGGRYLIVFVYPASQGTFRLATARDMNDAERRRYQRYRKE